MNSDPFEAELAGLRPHEPSEQLKQRIAAALDSPNIAQPQQTGLALWRAAGLAAGLIAATLLMTVFRPVRDRDPQRRNVVADVDVAQSQIARALDPSMPSVWTYRSALHQSTAGLDALLDRHSARAVPAPRRSAVPVFHQLTRIENRYDTLLGEL